MKNFVLSRRGIYALFALGVLVACIVFAGFIQQMTRTVEAEISDNMTELAKHDINNIESFMETQMEMLVHSTNAIRDSHDKTIPELEESISSECFNSPFEYLYLIDNKGDLYASNFEIIDASKNPFRKYFSKEDKFVTTEVIASKQRGNRNNFIVYGITFEPFTVDGVTFTSAVGTRLINLLESKLRIDSYNGMGFSSLIDDWGNYIVTAKNTSSVKSETNFYDNLANGTLEDVTLEQIQSAIQEERKISFEWKSHDGTEMVTEIEPLNENNWSFIMTVPKSAFTQQTAKLVSMTTGLLFSILIITIIIFLFMMRSARKRAANDARVQARSEFYSSLSHELRTPITGLLGLNTLMKHHVGEPEKIEEYLDQQNTSANYLLSLVNDVLDISKIEAGKTDFLYSPTNLEILINDSCMFQAETYKQRGVKLETQVDLTNPWIYTDKLHLQQVIMNILGNASKFTPEGGTVTITATQGHKQDRSSRQHENASADGNKADHGGKYITTYISVADTGIGMSAEFLKTIWDPFAQERSDKIQNEQKGTGLGMSISHSLITGLGGEIRVESELGKGSVFTIELPAEIAAPETVAAIEEGAHDPDQADQPSYTLADMSILLVDDNDLNAEILVELFESEGAKQVQRACDGVDAFEKFEASEPGSVDVILMDINMPRMNGYEATTKIRDLDRSDNNVFILATSAEKATDVEKDARAVHMNGCLEKPINIDLVPEAYTLLKNARDNDSSAFYMPPGQ